MRSEPAAPLQLSPRRSGHRTATCDMHAEPARFVIELELTYDGADDHDIYAADVSALEHAPAGLCAYGLCCRRPSALRHNDYVSRRLCKQAAQFLGANLGDASVHVNVIRKG